MRANKGGEYELFQTVWTGDGFDGEPTIDIQRLEASEEAILSVFTRTKGDKRNVVVLDFLS